MSEHPLFTLVAVYTTLLAVPVNGLGTTLLEGDIYVQVFAAMYSELHENGTCSGIESESVQNIAAIKWTFTELNKRNYIPGARIGVRLSETCQSVQKAGELAYTLANEMKNGSSDVIGVIGSDYSSDTDVISRLLSALPDQQRLLQIAYASTSTYLRNRHIYRNLYRVIPADDVWVKVLIDMVTRLNWTYIALIHDDDSYSIGVKDSLLAAVKSSDVCLPVQMSVTRSRYDITHLERDIYSKILNADPPIGGVLIFGSYFLADAVLKATENLFSQQLNVSYPVFLFSETSGNVEDHYPNITKGAFVVSPPRRTIDEFYNQWVQLFKSIQNLYNETKSNPWLRDAYEYNFGCELAEDILNNTCASITKSDIEEMLPSSLYNQYAIQAALLMGKVVKEIHSAKCGSLNGICSRMLGTSRHTLIDIMKHISVNLDQDFESFRIAAFQVPSDLILTFNGSVEVSIPRLIPVYEVYNYQVCDILSQKICLKQVAQFHTSLNVTTSSIKDYDQNGTEHTWPDIRKAQCPDNYLCSLCLNASGKDDSILFIPGDLYVVGIVPIHNIGPTPLECDGYRQGGLDIVEAIRFTVEEAETVYKDKVPKGNVGIIVIDSCNDPQIVQERMLTLHRLGVYKNGAYIPVGDKIIGYIGGWSSDISKAVGAITTRLEFPQISYGSTASILSRRSLYPYFLRVPSSDSEQARVLLNIVKELNANFIHIVYSESAYGEGGRDILLDLIKDMNICVAQTIGITDSTNPATFIQLLREYKDAKVVVMIVASYQVSTLINTFTNNILNKNEFLFISSEGWGTRISVTGLDNLIGSIIVTSELQLNDKFIDQMKDLKPDGSNVNPWIRPYMENYFHCYYEWSYNKTSGKKCTGHESLDVHQHQYRLDAWSIFAEKAALALLLGAKSAMVRYCEQSWTMCANLHNNTEGFVDILKQTRLTDDSGFPSRIFDDNGDGLAGYKIYVVDLSAEGGYKKIGSSEQDSLTFLKKQFEDVRGEVVTSQCGTQDVCQLCFPVPAAAAAEADAPVGFIVVTVILAIICCVLAAIQLFILKKHGCCLTLENGRPRLTNTYLTPIYVDSNGNGSHDNKHTRPELPPRSGDENYDHIQDSIESRSSLARQSPIGGRDETSHYNSRKGTPRSSQYSGSNQSSGETRRTIEGSTILKSSGFKTTDPMSGVATESVHIEDKKVLYQADGSYITSGSMKPNKQGVAACHNSNGTAEMTSPCETREAHINERATDFNDATCASNEGGYLKMCKMVQDRENNI